MDFSLLINAAPSVRSAPSANNSSSASGFAAKLAAVSPISSSDIGDDKSDPAEATLAVSTRDNGAVNDALDQQHRADEDGVLAEVLLPPAAISAATLIAVTAQTTGDLRHAGLATTPDINTAMLGSAAASNGLAVARERLQLMADASAPPPGSGTLSTSSPSPTHSEDIASTLDPATPNASPRHLLLDPEQLAQHLQRREPPPSPGHPATAPQTTAGSLSNAPLSPVDTHSPALTTQSLSPQSVAVDSEPGRQLLDGSGDSAGDPFSASPAQANSASRASTSAMTGSIPANIAAHISSPEWSRQLGHTLTRIGISPQTPDGDQRIELRLHPAELGPLSVSLRMGEHGAQAQFVSAHPHVRQAVEQALPQLREILAEQGIQLGQTSVSDHGQGTQGESSHDQSSGVGLSIGNAPGNIIDTGEPLIATDTTAVLDGRVDVYA